MKSLKGTKTAINLMKAFAGESQACRRYHYFASKAKKDKYIQIANIFSETEANESEHAKRFYKFLNEDLAEETIEITAAFPVHLGDTLSNLKASFEGETEEWKELYPEFAKIAKEEGFDDIAVAFTEIAEAEERHARRFKKLAENMENDRLFKRDEVVLWKCNNCGYIHEGTEAPSACPACLHPQGYFELFVETY